jgi:hypothetical protein
MLWNRGSRYHDGRIRLCGWYAAATLAFFSTIVPASSTSGARVPRCDRFAAQPLGFHSRGFQFVAEIFPPGSRHNPGDRPVAHFFEVEYPGSEWRVVARRRWSVTLPHEQMPQAAIVSRAGHLVTLDDHQEAGAGVHALGIVDRGGRFVRTLSLDELLDQSDLARIPPSDCGRLWREGTRFFFTDSPDAKLYIVLPWERAVEVILATGVVRRGRVAEYPELSAILSQDHPNEATDVWTLNLRFSSLSDFIDDDRP